MHRNQGGRGQERGRNAERDASQQPIAGQPRTDEEEDELQDREQVPSFLTARELQARDPSKAPPAPEGGRDPFAEEEDDEKPRTKPRK